MLKKLFSYKNEQTHGLSFGKIIDIKHNGINGSKITLKSGNTHPYEILKDITHPNIIPILKLSQQSVYTKKINPFSVFYEKDKDKYNEYVIEKIVEALNFIHTVLKKEYHALSMESVVLEESGNPLLCNFEKLTDFVSDKVDNEMIKSFTKSILNTHRETVSDETSELFNKVFKISIDSLSNMKTEEKIDLISLIKRNKTVIPTITSKYLFKTFIFDAEKDQNKEYKTEVLDFLFSLNSDYFYENRKALFSVLDTTIRLYLLNKFRDINFGELDDIASDLSLGLFVKDKLIRKQTIDFIFHHHFGSDAMSFLLESMLSCTDMETVSLICENLQILEREDINRSIYKLLNQFMTLEKSSLEVLKCIDKYYTTFDRVKLTKNILPSLCSRLIEKENQDYCFSLVEKILKFLKSNRNDSASSDWSFKSIKSILTKKQDASMKFEDRVSKFKKEDVDEWNEYEIE